MSQRIELSLLDTPIGPLLLAAGDGRLVGLDFDPDEGAAIARLAKSHPGWAVVPGAKGGSLVKRVASYFAGRIDALEEIPVAPVGTPFQLRVWQALRTIPVGKTISYLQLAERIGNPTAMRAVGAANGKNPVAVVIPCHRVIAKGGKLHGYGGGLWRKAWLLSLEGAEAGRQSELPSSSKNAMTSRIIAS
jgi:methylated-DNA-[protein]-cysteine S-methyltransferase